MSQDSTSTNATSRRKFLIGATTVAGVGLASAKASSAAFSCGGDITTTPITDTLSEGEKGVLTSSAAALTEEQVLLFNWSRAGYGENPVPTLTAADVQSLERAFIARDRRLYGLKREAASLAPNLAAEALGSDCCCCCCPASCCSAAAEAKPVRSRRVYA